MVDAVLTRSSEHSRGFKVRLTSGIIGRTVNIIGGDPGPTIDGTVETVRDEAEGNPGPSSADILAIALEDICSN